VEGAEVVGDGQPALGHGRCPARGWFLGPGRGAACEVPGGGAVCGIRRGARIRHISPSGSVSPARTCACTWKTVCSACAPVFMLCHASPVSCSEATREEI